MTKQRFMAGTLGPYVYDDEDQYSPSNDYFGGEFRESFITTGQGRVMGEPTHPEHVLRLKDLSGPDAVLITEFLTPTSINKVTGGTATGTVTDVQTWNDGSFYTVREATGTPGFDIRFTIPNVEHFERISTNLYYSGTLTNHRVELQIYNVDLSTWQTIYQLPIRNYFNLRDIHFPGDVTDYIDGSDNVLLRLYHVTAGNTSHYIYTDYIAIINQRIGV